MKLAALQMELVDGDVDRNVATAVKMIKEDEGDTDCYILPELFTSGYHVPSWEAAVERTPEVLETLSTLARRRQCAISGSLLHRDEQGRSRNRMFFIDKYGGKLAHYDKVHLFRLMNEHEHLAGGTELTVFDYDGWRFGLAVCYDLRFPVLFYRMALDGVEIFLACAEWPLARRNIMTTLARARAMETQSYLVLSNRAGSGQDGTVFGGSSLFCDPLGAGGEASADDTTLVRGTADKDALAAVRSKIRVFDDRVPAVDL